jgi:hypothetical protein
VLPVVPHVVLNIGSSVAECDGTTVQALDSVALALVRGCSANGAVVELGRFRAAVATLEFESGLRRVSTPVGE